MTPKIDYILLAEALAAYKARGYRYVEVPWMVSEDEIFKTLPVQCEPLRLGQYQQQISGDGFYPYREPSCLVGSAEQGFLSLKLPPGAYVGVTPCFRDEPKLDLFYQTGFMKIELFVNGDSADLEHVISDAEEVMKIIGGSDTEAPAIKRVRTAIGIDLMLGGIEIGSYGERAFHSTSWIYGTGLALPRFSVADAIHKIT